MVWAKKIEVLQGGATLYAAAIPASLTEVPAGTPVYVGADGFAVMAKTALMVTDATDGGYPVKKGSSFAVGDTVTGKLGATPITPFAITSIVSHPTYDELMGGTTNATPGLATDFIYVAASASALTGLTGEAVSVDSETFPGENVFVSVVLRGSVYEANIPPVSTAMKALLPHIIFL